MLGIAAVYSRFGTAHCATLCQTEYAIVPLPDAFAGTE